jgi:type IV secretory pathway VirD2 relaxase
MKGDGGGAKVGMMRRLAANRVYALGARSGALAGVQLRTGRPFRLDVRQRVIVKALVSRHAGLGAARGAPLSRHLGYLGRRGAGADAARPEFFDRGVEGVDPREATRGWVEDRHHFRFIISPEHGDRIADLRGYVRDVMSEVAADLKESDLAWIGVCHFDTDQPHAHVLVRGRRADGRDLVIPRAYMGYGFRARAQEAAQERLGDLSRVEAERRIWRETEADRFTAFDRRLIAAADAELCVPDDLGRSDPWGALTRGRLRHLERLGLAHHEGGVSRLDPQLEPKLRALQLRSDVIRTLNARRLAGVLEIDELRAGRVSGEVVRSGYHDELGASPFVIVRNGAGAEHYARLGLGATPPDVGRSVELVAGARGARVLYAARGRPGLER